LPAVAGVIIITVAFVLFSKKSPYISTGRQNLPEELPAASIATETTKTTGTQGSVTTVARTVSVDTAGMHYAGMDTIRVINTQETPESTVVMTVDTSATRERAEKRLAEEIQKMRDMYHEKRTALLNEAVGFLNGSNHSERAVKAKAANFRALGDKLLEDIDKFGKPSSEAEGKLWDAQKEELRKSASFCHSLADRISATQADPRRMKITASQLQAAGAP